MLATLGKCVCGLYIRSIYGITVSILKYDNFFFFFFLLFRATAYGGSQARGHIGATAAGLCHSYSNTRSKLLIIVILRKFPHT